MNFSTLDIINTNGTTTTIKNGTGKDKLELYCHEHDYLIKKNDDVLFIFPMHGVVAIYDEDMYSKYDITVESNE